MKPLVHATIAVAAIAGLVGSAPSIAQTTSTGGLTRAEVRAQLVEAEQQGLLPTNNIDYPPSAETIARNRQLYALAHGGEAVAANGRDAASTGVSSSTNQ